MLKALPRQSVELSFKEVSVLISALFSKPSDSTDKVKEFEERVAAFVGVKEAVTFSSQRAGMYAVLKALGPKPGDEVIVPAYTFFSVPACVVLAGFTPVFVDVLPDTWNLDPEKAKAALSPRTRAIIVTHLNGCPADMEPLTEIAKKAGVTLIEDCAQALGATYHSKPVGSFGTGCFSFGEGKNLYAMGGGLVTTNDEDLALRLRKAQNMGKEPPFSVLAAKSLKSILFRLLTYPPLFALTAYPAVYLSSLRNGRVDTESEHTLKDMLESSPATKFCNLQAVLGLAQFDNLEERNRKRVKNARKLQEALQGTPEMTLPPDPSDRTHLYLHYAVRVKNRELFIRRLIQQGVDAQRDYCSFCPDLPDFQPYAADSDKTTVARSLAGNVAYLPNQPSLREADMLHIAEDIRKFPAS